MLKTQLCSVRPYSKAIMSATFSPIITQGACVFPAAVRQGIGMKSEYDSNHVAIIFYSCKMDSKKQKQKIIRIRPTVTQPNLPNLPGENQNKPNQNIVTHHPETNRHTTWKWMVWNTLLVFPLGQKAPFSGAFAVSFRECIHLLSSHHPYPFLPIFPHSSWALPTHLTSATHIRSPETASGITLPSATRSPWSPKTLHLASTTWGIGEDSKHIDSPRSVVSSYRKNLENPKQKSGDSIRDFS